MVGMGAEARNTIKGHGIVLGDVFDFYGYDETPTAQADRVVITKEGNLYVLTVTDGKFAGERVAKLGAAKKIWASKVETSESPVAEAITNVSEHGFSGRSRRPMECRLCGEPAEVHSTTTDEGSSRQMWVKARTPLVTDHVKAWSGRTARVLEAIAELGGTVDAWDLGSGRGWHKTAVRIVRESGALIQTNPGEIPATYTLTDMGRQACEWYGFNITEPVKPVTVEIHKPAEQIPTNPEPFTDRDMRDQIVAYLGSDVDAYYVDGIVDHLIKTHNGAINLDDVDAGSWHRVVAVFHKPTEVPPINSGIPHVFVPKAVGEGSGPLFCVAPCHGHKDMPFHVTEAEVWSGTDTLIKPAIRTALGKRKRKATRKARRAVKGGF